MMMTKTFLDKNVINKWKTGRFVSKQGHLYPVKGQLTEHTTVTLTTQVRKWKLLTQVPRNQK